MTTVAMGAGMLPVALGLGAADASFRTPMAVAVIGGLMRSLNGSPLASSWV
jgi:multidrug efflux pump subunit AcrB